jgi:hypothetical protein
LKRPTRRRSRRSTALGGQKNKKKDETNERFQVDLYPSPRKHKKWRVVIYPSRKSKKDKRDPHPREIVDFGDSRYKDFTQHNDADRRKAYLRRHKANEHWDCVNTAGFWSRYLLWECPSIRQAIQWMEKRFPLRIRRRRVHWTV